MSRRTAALAVAALITAALITAAVLLPPWGVPSAGAVSAPPVPAELAKGRVLLLRPGRLDIARDGVVRRYVLVGPRIALADLPRLVGDPDYVAWSRPGVLRLRATIAQRPGSILDAGGAPLTRLELDETGTEPVQLLGTRARLHLRGISVALAGTAPVRLPVVGLIRYVNFSTVELRALTVTGLGDPAGRLPAVRVTSGSVVALHDVRFEGGGPGLQLDGVTRATLSGVSVRSAHGHGVQVNAGGSLLVRSLRISGAYGEGLRITGPVASLDVSDVVASDNHGDAVTLLTQRGGRLARLRTTHNRGDALSLRAVSDAVVEDVESSWDTRALNVEGGSGTAVRRLASSGGEVVVNGSERLMLERPRVRWIPGSALKISGRNVVVRDGDVDQAGEGVVVGAGAIGVTARAVTASQVSVTGGTFVGRHGAVRVTPSAVGTTLVGVVGRAPVGVALQVSGPDTLVRAGIWSGAGGVRVRDQARGVVFQGAHVTSSGPALDISPTGVGDVTVIGTTLTGAGRRTVTSAARHLALRWTVVSGGALGVDLRGDGEVESSQVSGSRQGVRVTGGHRASVRGSRVQAGDLGIVAVPGSSVQIIDAVVRADLAVRGDATITGSTYLSPRPLRGVALAAGGMLLLALALEALRRLREPAAARRVDAPAHVTNRS